MAMDEREKACFLDEEITEFYKLVGEYDFWLTWGTGGQRLGIKI
ncbi:MAG: hypothetical protein K0Q54_2578, partial [Methylobacterium brachiatum]|nr:hypothetical protein [Methylobacterium brachiatum]